MSYTSPILENGNYHIFVKPDLYDITNRQYEEQKKLAEFIQWGRRNPVLAAEELLGVEFLDYQKYVFMMSWNTPNVVWCMSRNAGKSILGAIYIMMRTLLISNHKTYILCGVGSQSIEMFTKIEKLTNNEIPSFRTLTDIFKGEIIKSNANSKGFVHNPASYHFSVYNGAEVFTLNGAYDNNRSKRSNLNFYDECMNSPDELFTTSEPFVLQNAKFALGRDYDETDMLVEPEPFYNQLIYASSAGRTDGYFFKKYKECSLRMDAGDKRYFCADVDCNAVLKATKRGIALPEALLTQETIDSAMRKDKLAALREYYNKFETEGSDQQIIRRSDIARLSKPYVPELKNVDNRSFYALSYDPARRLDGSIITVARFWEDPDVGWKCRIVNCVLLMDRLSKQKRMINTPNQVEILKQMIVAYNGEGVADYENIKGINVDSGAGGGGVLITDFIANSFEVNDIQHRGLIDNEYNEGDKKKYPDAIDGILHLISPVKYRSEMFEEAIQMVSQNLVEFPEEYNDRGYVDLIYEVYEDGSRKQRFSYPSEAEEKKWKKEKKKIQIDTVRYYLDEDEEAALVQIEAMKTEICNMYRFKQTSGKDRFELAPDKANYLHDDRNYTFILMMHLLFNLRRSNITGKRKADTSEILSLPIRKGKITRMFG